MKKFKKSLILIHCLSTFCATGLPLYSSGGIFMEQEIWKDIKGFEGCYMISNLGNIKGIPKDKNCVGRKRVGGIPRIGREGYMYIALRKEGKNVNKTMHRLMCEAFIPNPENKPCVNHKNSDRTDYRLENLEWCTYSENNKHAHEFGFQKKTKGESHNQALLTEIQVLEIRSKYIKNVYTSTMLARDYGVSNSCIKCILQRVSWTHI